MSCLNVVLSAAAVFMLMALDVSEVRAQTCQPDALPDLVLWLDASDAQTVTQVGGLVSEWANKGAGATNRLTSQPANQPTWVSWPTSGNTMAMRFDGADTLRDLAFGQTAIEVTLFIVAAPRVNDGVYPGFLSANAAGESDYRSGFNVDQTFQSSSAFDRVNFEGPKLLVPGGADYFGGSFPFETPHILQLDYHDQLSQLSVDGAPDGTQATTEPGDVVMDEVRVGARFYDLPSGSPPVETGYFDGDVAEILVYSRALSVGESEIVGSYLAGKYQIASG